MPLSVENVQAAIRRRSFLLRLAAAGVAVPGLLRGRGAAEPDEDEAGLARLSARHFEAIQDPRFRIREDDGSFGEFVLADVRRAPSDPGRPTHEVRGESFSVLFRPTVPATLRQEVREVVHPQLGTLRLLLVPVGPFRGEARYEAVFS